MYVEFSLPRAEHAGPALLLIRHSVLMWALGNDLKYTEKTIKYTHRVCFDQDEYYTLFALTFNRSNPVLQFRIVSDLNNKI
jgi:hypothetical protein